MILCIYLFPCYFKLGLFSLCFVFACVYMYTCVFMRILAHACGDLKLAWGVFYITLYFICWGWISHIKCSWLACLGDLVSASCVLELQVFTCDCQMGSGNLSSGFHSYTASTLSTEPSLQTLVFSALTVSSSTEPSCPYVVSAWYFSFCSFLLLFAHAFNKFFFFLQGFAKILIASVENVFIELFSRFLTQITHTSISDNG